MENSVTGDMDALDSG